MLTLLKNVKVLAVAAVTASALLVGGHSAKADRFSVGFSFGGPRYVAPVYASPVYPVYRPAYVAPVYTPAYCPPPVYYSAPVYGYSAPDYYSAPVYRPTYSYYGGYAPHFYGGYSNYGYRGGYSGGYHGGGYHGGGAFFGFSFRSR
jgi:hypothetical protein